MKRRNSLIVKPIYLSCLILGALFYLLGSVDIGYGDATHNETTGKDEKSANRLWCEPHGVYEDECFICNPELKDKSEEHNHSAERLWCKAHGVYEDECFICHPELEDKSEGHNHNEGRLWCEPHGVYEDECYICNPELEAKNDGHNHSAERLWCKAHGVYEDECFICHPELEDKSSGHNHSAERLWCKAHGVYEDECFICHPELEDKGSGKEQEQGLDHGHDHGAGGVRLYCNEHDMYENECGICHPELAAGLKPGKGLKIRLESENSAAKAGVTTAVPEVDEATAGPEALCRAAYNQNLLAHITPLTSGVIRNVLVDLGESVSKNDVLVEIVSPEIAKAKADYLTALSDKTFKEIIYEREKGLFQKRISSQHEYQEALAGHRMAINTANTKRQQLLNYGFTEHEIAEIITKQSSSSSLPVRAPFSGTVIERHAVIGEAVEPGSAIFSLADLSTMWLEISIPEGGFAFFSVGDKIEAHFNSLPGAKIYGELTWLSSNIEEESRMLRARAVVKNHDLRIKDGMFGGIVLAPESKNGLFVSPDSIQRFDEKPFVFVKLSDDLYEARRVELGGKNMKKVEIVAGLSGHDKVVVNGSFTLKSEFLKSRMGAGCAHE